MRFTLAFCSALLTLPATARAQEAPATTRLQDAQLVASGNTITISRLPIRTAHGTLFRDVTIELQVDAQGHVTLATDSAGHAIASGMPAAAPAAPAQVALRAVPSGQKPEQRLELAQRPSAPIVFQHFTPGTYTGADGSLIQVQDRGMDMVHHVPSWGLSSPTGAAITAATWYSGPPFLNPRSSRLQRARITSTAFAYGIADEGGGGVFGTGALIGVRQDGPKLIIASFHHGCCTDEAEPVATLTFTRLGS